MELNKEMVAASATPLILSILRNGDSYGYEIIQQVNQLSDGAMAWADGMLYPILHRLEKKQHIESYWELADSGRRRKYYRLTASGIQELELQRNNWRQLSSMLDRLEE
jgi:DNA-binding PadR family transcriptional regulator